MLNKEKAPCTAATVQDAETLNHLQDSTKTAESQEAGQISVEELDLTYTIARDYFFEWANHINDEDQQQEREMIQRFAKETNATEKSPLVMMFTAFLGGISSGIDLCNTLDKAVEDKTA